MSYLHPFLPVCPFLVFASYPRTLLLHLVFTFSHITCSRCPHALVDPHAILYVALSMTAFAYHGSLTYHCFAKKLWLDARGSLRTHWTRGATPPPTTSTTNHHRRRHHHHHTTTTNHRQPPPTTTNHHQPPTARFSLILHTKPCVSASFNLRLRCVTQSHKTMRQCIVLDETVVACSTCRRQARAYSTAARDVCRRLLRKSIPLFVSDLQCAVDQ